MHYAPLYHVTTLACAADIWASQKMKPGAFTDPVTGKKGVSLTRSMHFASAYIPHRSVILQFNQEKLRHNHKLVPSDYWNSHKPVKASIIADECEEFIPGTIENLDTYLEKMIFQGKRSLLLAIAESDRQIRQFLKDSRLEFRN